MRQRLFYRGLPLLIAMFLLTTACVSSNVSVRTGPERTPESGRIPSIEVTILQRISVLGGVRQPGLYSVEATHTVSNALTLAGGVEPEGTQEDIRLIRRGEVIRQSLDVATVVGSSSIQAGDQIVVRQKKSS